MADAYETAIAEQRLAIQAQDAVIGNLREQRDVALTSSGGFFTNYLVPVLIGAAAATLIIGIRR